MTILVDAVVGDFFDRQEQYTADVAHAVRGMNGVSRLFRGRGIGSLAHLRFT